MLTTLAFMVILVFNTTIVRSVNMDINPFQSIKVPLYEQTLAYVNKARRARGLPPLFRLPCGVPVSSRQCPVARGLGDTSGYVTRVHYYCSNKRTARKIALAWGTSIERATFNFVQLPDIVKEFILEFDKPLFSNV